MLALLFILSDVLKVDIRIWELRLRGKKRNAAGTYGRLLSGPEVNNFGDISQYLSHVPYC